MEKDQQAKVETKDRPTLDDAYRKHIHSRRLEPRYLTKSKSTWVLHIKAFYKAPSRKEFQTLWNEHPEEYQPLFIFGKRVFENRYSQLYITDSIAVGDGTYKYSGTSKKCVICDEEKRSEQFIVDLCRVADQAIAHLIDAHMMAEPDNYVKVNADKDEQEGWQKYFNCCLMNWYQPEHNIGLHADDEMEMDNSYPIISLSWGGPRRFLLRPKPNTKGYLEKLTEIVLNDGDLLVMGGLCQKEFKHEVPKVRKKDGLVSERISWTIRKMWRKTNKRKRESSVA